MTLKLATSLDGKIALGNGQSEWITGERAREQGRMLRGEHDAIAIGSNTAVIDNPQLTTRIKDQADPIRVIFDTKLRLSPKSNLAQTAEQTPVWVFTEKTSGDVANTLKDLGVKLFQTPVSLKIELESALGTLLDNGVKTLLLEGGGTLAASFFEIGAIDRIAWFRAPIILGADGRSGIGNLALQELSNAKRFSRVSIEEIGDDLYEQYEQVS